MQRLRVGSFADDPLTHRFLSTFRQRRPGVPLSYVELSISNQVSSVIDGLVDLAFVWLPVQDPRVNVDLLYSEMPVAALSTLHRLAGESRVHVDDLLEDAFALASADTPPEWRSHWSLDAYRGGPPQSSIAVSSARESLAAVAYSGTVDTLSTNSASLWQHPGVRFLPLVDARPTSLALVSSAQSRSPLVDAFREVVADVVAAELAAVPGAVSLVS
nr:LysR family substrate-binding domain-containing protein [Microbacterium sp. LMC-P-041]